MKIKEVCERTGLTKKAVRYYEEEGLFAPEHTTMNLREYRDYTEKDLEALGRIAALRSLSFSIEEIRTMMGDPETAPGIFRERQARLQAGAEETARQLRFYQGLDYDRRPFLEYVYARLEEEDLWAAPRPREKAAAPAFLVLLPGLAALAYPVLRQLLALDDLTITPFRMSLHFWLYCFSHILGGAAIAYVAFHGEDFRRNRAAKLSVWVWTLLLLAAVGGWWAFYWLGIPNYFLDYLSMENLYAVLGGYVTLCFCLRGKGEDR